MRIIGDNYTTSALRSQTRRFAISGPWTAFLRSSNSLLPQFRKTASVEGIAALWLDVVPLLDEHSVVFAPYPRLASGKRGHQPFARNRLRVVDRIVHSILVVTYERFATDFKLHSSSW